MIESSKSGVKARNFGLVFQQMCNFLAVSKTGKPEETICGLIILCFMTMPNDRFSEPEHIRNAISTLFGIDISIDRLQECLHQLEKGGSLSQVGGINYVLDPKVKNQYQIQIEDFLNLEERVKSSWLDSISKQYSEMPLEEAWEALKKYLFRLLDDTVSRLQLY